LTTWTISSGGLNTSPEGSVRTPPLYQPRLLRESNCLVLGWVSGLDAFSPYPVARGCAAMPYQTTAELEAPGPCSSRTKGPFPSGSDAS